MTWAVDGTKNIPLIGPPKKYKDIEDGFLNLFCILSDSIKQVFGFFPRVLEGLGSSGALVGTISTYPGT